jgi:undecaprenyl-diphosphatase
MPTYRPAKERERDLLLISLGLGASATALLLLTRVALRPTPNRVDVALTKLLQRRHSKRARRAMALISLPGFAPLEHALTVGTALDFWSFGYRREALFTLLTMGAGAITGVVKVAVGRPRPDHSLRRSSVLLRDNSFPSGHCAHYAAFYGFLFYLARRSMAPSPLRSAILALCLGLIVLVPPSRVFLGHHWSSDVVAGTLLGLTYLFVLIEAYERLAVTERAPRTVS